MKSHYRNDLMIIIVMISFYCLCVSAKGKDMLDIILPCISGLQSMKKKLAANDGQEARLK
jgi:hypothetical protein